MTAVNPLYADVPDAWWSSGYCAIFAHALQQRAGGQMRALIAKAADGNETMVHTMTLLPDGRLADSRGIRPADAKDEVAAFGYGEWSLRDFADLLFRPEHQVRIEIEAVDCARLSELTPEDVDATAAAHAFIDAHHDLFVDLPQAKTKRLIAP